MVAVFLFAAPQTTDVDLTHWDKLVHVGAYAVFGVFNLRAFHGRTKRGQIYFSTAGEKKNRSVPV